jgi:ribosomal protein S12 methylthiotransferase accessory factor
MIHTNYTTPLPEGYGCFTATSNGLASGNNTMEAISHGICEVIERDATTRWKLKKEPDRERRRLRLETVDDPSCQELLAKYDHAGLAVAIWDVTSDIRIATFACTVVSREDWTWHSAVAMGYGCHPLREIALSRALTEAAQCRLTMIAGVRDDFRRDPYRHLLDRDVLAAIRSQISAAKPTRSFSDAPSRDGETLEEDVAWEVECLQRAGLGQVLVTDLTRPEFGLPVVRVIIPGAEPIAGPDYVPGRRARVVLAGEA